MSSTFGKQINDGPSDDKPASSLDRFDSGLAVVIDQLDANIGRMDNILGRAFGDKREEGETGPSAVPMGVLGTIDHQIGILANLAKRQAELINRLEQIV